MQRNYFTVLFFLKVYLLRDLSILHLNSYQTINIIQNSLKEISPYLFTKTQQIKSPTYILMLKSLFKYLFIYIFAA